MTLTAAPGRTTVTVAVAGSFNDSSNFLKLPTVSQASTLEADFSQGQWHACSCPCDCDASKSAVPSYVSFLDPAAIEALSRDWAHRTAECGPESAEVSWLLARIQRQAVQEITKLAPMLVITGPLEYQGVLIRTNPNSLVFLGLVDVSPFIYVWQEQLRNYKTGSNARHHWTTGIPGSSNSHESELPRIPWSRACQPIYLCLAGTACW